jgi:CheY-like chemotaxis protein
MTTLQDARDFFPSRLVLIIDDDAQVLDATAGLLESWGYSALTANSERAAMEGIRSAGFTPELMICDYRLSNGVYGTDVAKRLHSELNKSIPTIIVSGDTFADHLRDLCTSGHLILHKPVTPGSLRSALQRLLGRSAGPSE